VNKWAILVGVNNYVHMNNLQYSVNDISKLHIAFRDYLDFPEENIVEISDDTEKEPDRDIIYHELGFLVRQNLVKPDDLLVFYFTGHGMLDTEKQEDYLLPTRASPYTLELTGCKVGDIVSMLKQLKCKNVVMFLDACREVVGGAKGGSSIGLNTESLVSRAGIATFFSCNPTSLSYEIEQLEHGSFTYNVLQAIENPNCNTINEIDEFLRTNVPITNRKYQKPIQLPYTKIEPVETGMLSIFNRMVQIVTGGEGLEDIMSQLYGLYDEGQLEAKLYSRCIDIVDGAKNQSIDENAKKKILRIKEFCNRTLTSSGKSLSR